MDRGEMRLEALSAWYDDEPLPDESFADLEIDEVVHDAAAREACATFAVIGAALRGEPLSHPKDGFVDTVLARIATVEKDRAGVTQPPAEALTALPPAPPMTQPARNDVRWSWGAVAAAVVAAVVIALLALPVPEGKGGVVPGVAQRSPLFGGPAGPLAVSGRAPSSLSHDSGGAITRVAVSHSPYYILAHSPTQPVGGWPYRAESSAAPLTARSNR